MVWGGISAEGKSDLCFIDATINKEKYMEVLEEFLLPFSYCAYGTRITDFVFMKDNAAVHTVRECKKCVLSLKMNVLPWPGLSPDLNSI